jgi:hypothetical protein
LYEFGYEGGQTILTSFTIAMLDNDIFPLDITEVSQSLPECIGERIGSSGRRGNSSLQKSDPWDFRWLLRLGGNNRNEKENRE